MQEVVSSTSGLQIHNQQHSLMQRLLMGGGGTPQTSGARNGIEDIAARLHKQNGSASISAQGNGYFPVSLFLSRFWPLLYSFSFFVFIILRLCTCYRVVWCRCSTTFILPRVNIFHFRVKLNVFQMKLDILPFNLGLLLSFTLLIMNVFQIKESVFQIKLRTLR